MSSTVQEICRILERLAPPEYAYDWDNVGAAGGQGGSIGLNCVGDVDSNAGSGGFGN